MPPVTLTVRVDEATKNAFMGFCEQVGMSVSTALNVFMRQTVRDQRLPFVISLGGDKPAAVLEQAEIERVVREACVAFPAIRRVVLFGSYARREATPASDVDLRVLYDENSGFSLFDLGGFVDEVERRLGKEVDVVSKRTIDNVRFARAIETEGIVLYER